MIASVDMTNDLIVTSVEEYLHDLAWVARVELAFEYAPNALF